MCTGDDQGTAHVTSRAPSAGHRPTTTSPGGDTDPVRAALKSSVVLNRDRSELRASLPRSCARARWWNGHLLTRRGTGSTVGAPPTARSSTRFESPVIGNGFEVAVSGSSRDMQSVMYDGLAWLQISRAMHLFLIDLQGEIDVLDRLMYRRSRINVNLVVEVTRDVLFREPSRALEQEGFLADPLLLQ